MHGYITSNENYLKINIKQFLETLLIISYDIMMQNITRIITHQYKLENLKEAQLSRRLTNYFQIDLPVRSLGVA